VIAGLLNTRSYAELKVGDYAAAIRDQAEAVRLSREQGDLIQLSPYLGNLGMLDVFAGDLGAARRHMAEALNISRAINDRAGTVQETLRFGLAKYLGGALDAAAALFAWEAVELEMADRDRQRLRAVMGDAAFEDEYAAGTALAPGQVVAMHRSPAS